MHNVWNVEYVSVETFWHPEMETDLYSWVVIMPLTLSWEMAS